MEIRDRLAAVGTRVRGDERGGAGDLAIAKPLRDAAVLVPLIDRPGGATVLLTERAANLAEHAGQVSFPGGHCEVWDSSVEATALRETMEEVGIPASSVEVLGRLDLCVTGTGFRIAPVVGRLRTTVEPVADPMEVAAIFEVPLAFLFDPANLEKRTREVSGRIREFYAFSFERWLIWGATAAILVNLRDTMMAGVGG